MRESLVEKPSQGGGEPKPVVKLVSFRWGWGDGKNIFSYDIMKIDTVWKLECSMLIQNLLNQYSVVTT